MSLRQGFRNALVAIAVIIAIVAVASVPTGASAQTLPFVGVWDCEVDNFTFTEKSYHNGTNLFRFKSIKISKSGDYTISFPDGGRISLFDVERNSMSWHSPASGDTFDCKRVDGVTSR